MNKIQGRSIHGQGICGSQSIRPGSAELWTRPRSFEHATLPFLDPIRVESWGASEPLLTMALDRFTGSILVHAGSGTVHWALITQYLGPIGGFTALWR